MCHNCKNGQVIPYDTIAIQNDCETANQSRHLSRLIVVRSHCLLLVDLGLLDRPFKQICRHLRHLYLYCLFGSPTFISFLTG